MIVWVLKTVLYDYKTMHWLALTSHQVSEKLSIHVMIWHPHLRSEVYRLGVPTVQMGVESPAHDPTLLIGHHIFSMKRPGTGLQGGGGSVHVLVVQDAPRKAPLEADGDGTRGPHGDRERPEGEEEIVFLCCVPFVLLLFSNKVHRFLSCVTSHTHTNQVFFCVFREELQIFRSRVKVFAASFQIMLLSLTAGGVGLNLVGANHLMLLDLHWNPQLEAQAQDRVYRVGQKKPVYIWK